MWKRSIVLCFVMVFAAVTSSCIFDPPEDKGNPVDPSATYRFPAKNRVDVLHNLELAYNDRKITQYEKVLDDGFTFFYTDGDVGSGGGVPVQWDRTEEVTVNTRLFATSKGPSDTWPLCTSIDMDVQFEQNLQWFEVIPQSAPDEVWQSTTVFYDFQIEVAPDTKYIPVSGSKAQFTIRNAGTEKDPNWKLVEWRDLGSGN